MSLGKRLITTDSAVAGDSYFTPIQYSGGSSGQSVTVGMQPDMIIGKRRDATQMWWVNDVARSGKSLFWGAEQAEISFEYTTPTSTGFTVNGSGGVHNTGNLVAYCFKAGGSTVTNTNGSITTNVSANQAAGFSILTYTGNTTAGATVGHGLSSAPEFIVSHSRDTTGYWNVGSSSIGFGNYLSLNETDQSFASGTPFSSTSPNGSVVTLGSYTATNSGNMVMYCFHSVTGVQKFGTYSGTGGSISAINVGFQPRFVMVKRLTNAGGGWAVFDNLRSNTSLHQLSFNSDHIEFTDQGLTFTSTGFQPRQSVW